MLERITSQQHARAPKPSPQGKVAASADGKGPLYVPCVRTTQLHAGARTQSYEYLRAPATSNNLQIHQTHKRPAPGAALRSAPVLSLGERLRYQKPSPQGKVPSLRGGKGPLYGRCIRRAELPRVRARNGLGLLRAPAASNGLRIHQSYKRPAPSRFARHLRLKA